MNKFEAGKTYPLRGGGQGEIFVTKDGKHWGRIMPDPNRYDLPNYGFPACWNEKTGKNNAHNSGVFDLIAPPTTVTGYANIYNANKLGKSLDVYDTEKIALSQAHSTAIHKAIPIHITTHGDGRVTIVGGS